MSTASTFFHDGYRAYLIGSIACPPDEPVLAAEYWAGFMEAKRWEERRLASRTHDFVLPQGYTTITLRVSRA